MKKSIFILIFSLAIISNARAQLTVAALLQLRETANSLLAETGNIVDRQRQQVFIDLSALLSYSFDRIDGTLDDVDRKLTRKERTFYAQLDNVIQKAQAAIDEKSVDILNDLDKSVGNAMAEIPFFKKNPYPTTIRTPFIGENSSGTFKVKVEGVKLENPRNYAMLNGVRSTKTFTKSKDEVIFEIPVSHENLTIGSGNVLKIVLFKGRRKEHVFETPFWVYPSKFAEVTFHYTYTKDVITTDNYTQLKTMRSANACSWTHNSSNIPRRNQGNWSIDVGSVSVTELGQAPGGGDCFIESVTPALIGTRVTARSDCRGSKIFNPEQGTTTCRYSWREKLITPTEFNDTISVALSYNESRALTDFQFGITRFRKAIIKYYNGQVFEFTHNTYLGDLIEYEFNGVNESFQVRAAFGDFSNNE